VPCLPSLEWYEAAAAAAAAAKTPSNQVRSVRSWLNTIHVNAKHALSCATHGATSQHALRMSAVLMLMLNRTCLLAAFRCYAPTTALKQVPLSTPCVLKHFKCLESGGACCVSVAIELALLLQQVCDASDLIVQMGHTLRLNTPHAYVKGQLLALRSLSVGSCCHPPHPSTGAAVNTFCAAAARGPRVRRCCGPTG
jgi:hypothetical protein